MGGFRRLEIPLQRRDLAARSQPRRGRRTGRIARKRTIFTFLVLLPLFFFGAFHSFFSWQHLLLDNAGSENNGNSEIDLHQGNLGNDRDDWVHMSTTMINDSERFRTDTPKRSNRTRRKHHGPCVINFAKSVEYLMEPDDYMNSTRFSLEYIVNEKKPDGQRTFTARFAGHQTLEERENSFYAQNQIIHCGFVGSMKEQPGTGFDLDEKDRKYMNVCKVVVSSCIFGAFDFLRRLTRSKISEYSKKNVCFVMFVDKLTITKLYSDGQIPDDNGYIGLWRVVEVNNLPYLDARKSGKVPKFLSHRLFPSARYSIWIDSKMRLTTDPMRILEYFLWRKRSEYAISNHYDRHCVWEEVLQNKRLNKYNHTAIDKQFNFYQLDGLTKFNESDTSVPLPSYVPEGSFIVRAHTEMSNLFSCLWFNEVDRFTSRDQLSFAHTFLKLRRMNPERPLLLNMFKDCERRALAKLFRHRNEYPPPSAVAP